MVSKIPSGEPSFSITDAYIALTESLRSHVVSLSLCRRTCAASDSTIAFPHGKHWKGFVGGCYASGCRLWARDTGIRVTSRNLVSLRTILIIS